MIRFFGQSSCSLAHSDRTQHYRASRDESFPKNQALRTRAHSCVGHVSSVVDRYQLSRMLRLPSLPHVSGIFISRSCSLIANSFSSPFKEPLTSRYQARGESDFKGHPTLSA